jgi:hypothetical protein
VYRLTHLTTYVTLAKINFVEEVEGLFGTLMMRFSCLVYFDLNVMYYSRDRGFGSRKQHKWQHRTVGMMLHYNRYGKGQLLRGIGVALHVLPHTDSKYSTNGTGSL